MSVASFDRSLAIDAAIKACEHFAGEIISGIPALPSSSSACEELKMCAFPHLFACLKSPWRWLHNRAAEALVACLPMVEITKKNSKFVEGVVCQIIEPDLQQTASYIRRMREKGPERVASSLRRHEDGLQMRAERMWNCINALSSAADGSDGLSSKRAPSKQKTEPLPDNLDDLTLQRMPSLSSVQSSARRVTRSQSQNDAPTPSAPLRPGSVPLPQPPAAHFPPKAPASFRPPRSLRPLHTPHAYASHLQTFNTSSPLAAISQSSGTPAALSGQLPFSPSPHPTGYFALPQASSPAFASAPLPGTTIAEPPMAAFLQSAADAARRFRKSNSLTPRHSTLRPRSASPPKPTLPSTPTAFPEIFSPDSSQSNSVKLPVSAAAQGPIPELDGPIRKALSAQEELSAELDRHDAMAAASLVAKPPLATPSGLGAEFEKQMRASASVIEAASREFSDHDADAVFSETLQQAASAQDEVSRELDAHEAKRVQKTWDATVAAAASAQDDLSHELELRSTTAAGGGASGSIGDAFGELERQVEEVSREMQSMPGVGGGRVSPSGKPPRASSLRRDSTLERRATLGIQEIDDFADEAADVIAEGGI